MKTCNKCNTEKELTEFSVDKSMKSGRHSYCKSCFTEYKRNLRKQPNYIQNENLKKRYGITYEQYVDRLEEQNGVCKLCMQPNRGATNLAVDHCHTTGTVRGLLCNHCNKALGHFKDDQQLLSNAIEYLKSSPF